MQGNKQSVLAQRLRALRQARDWTLKQAAAATGVSASALSKIENGLLSPTYDNLIKIAAGLDLTWPSCSPRPTPTWAPAAAAWADRGRAPVRNPVLRPPPAMHRAVASA